MLIVNAGIMTIDKFVESPAQVQQNMMDVNVYHVAFMCRTFLPQLVKGKRSALIVNSSIASEFPLPAVTVYSATKAFATFLTRSLAIEHKGDPIDI